MIKIYENELPMPVRNDGVDSVRRYSHAQWARKVKEELGEAMDAGSPEEMAEELTDIITVCTSWLEAMGYDMHDRMRLCKEVNIKNQSRGILMCSSNGRMQYDYRENGHEILPR